MQHNYLAYTRVSTAKQGEGVSLQEQTEAIRRYAARERFEISRWFEEKETAAKRGRPVFGEMLRILEKGEAKGVLIHKIDRSARNLRDWANLGELIDAGIEVHFANESLDMNSRGGRLSADIQAVVAADYIRNLREETRKGFYGRLKQGFFPLPALLGYIDNGGGQLKTLEPATAPLVKKAFELYASGQYSFQDLIAEMYRRGLRNRRGGKLTKNGLSLMFNNPFYVGIIRLRSTGETFQGAHEPLVSARLFDQVQRVLKGKTQRTAGKHEFLFRRMFRCKCGYALVGERQKGHVYYRCHTKACPTTGLREELLETRVRERLQPLRFTPFEVQYLLSQIEMMREEWKDREEEEKAAIRLRLGKIKERLVRLTDVFLDGQIEKNLFEERKAVLLMNRQEFEDRLSAIEDGREPRLPETLRDLLELAESTYSSYEAGLSDEKRDLLRIVTSNRTVRDRNVEITLKEPFRLIAERPSVMNSTPYRDRHRILDAVLADLIKHCLREEEQAASQRP